MDIERLRTRWNMYIELQQSVLYLQYMKCTYIVQYNEVCTLNLILYKTYLNETYVSSTLNLQPSVHIELRSCYKTLNFFSIEQF